MECAPSTLYEQTELRNGSRIHLFVVATLCWDEGWVPVHIRNMSIRGALIEADSLPRLGTRVVLKRGSLETAGHIAWVAERQAGLGFGSAVRVSDWMVRRPNAHQDRVDEIVAGLKSETADVGQTVYADQPDRGTAVEAELALLKADLVHLGNALATDVILVATHPEIQLIDIALQRVQRITAVLERMTENLK